MEFNKQIAVTEGLMFVNGDEGTSIDDLKFILETQDDDLINKIIDTLVEKYKNDDMSGITIQKFNKDKYRMVTKKEHAEHYQKLSNIKTEARLSTASIETVSIIAYRGPITKAKVEELRGVNCDSIFYKLKLRNLIEEAGKADEVGKPRLYKVTEDFLKYFNLSSLEDLPELKETYETEDKDIFSRS